MGQVSRNAQLVAPTSEWSVHWHVEESSVCVCVVLAAPRQAAPLPRGPPYLRRVQLQSQQLLLQQLQSALLAKLRALAKPLPQPLIHLGDVPRVGVCKPLVLHRRQARLQQLPMPLFSQLQQVR